MNITIKGNGIKVRLGEDDSLLLMSALYLFMQEHWSENANDDKERSKQMGLIQWIGNVFE